MKKLNEIIPKGIFVGSTSYDLIDLRAEIISLLEGLGFVPIYFESPKFPVSGGLHSHDACIEAVKCCESYILIINQRYGQSYAGTTYPDMCDISVTHAEVRAAFNLGKRVYTFVRQAIWDERIIYKKNLKLGVTIQPVHAENTHVYNLIDEVLHRQTDNWLYFVGTFDNSVSLKKLIATALLADNGRLKYTTPTECTIPQSPILGFLDALGLQESIGNIGDRYYSLPFLFVPPAQYGYIKELLELKHFVLILGDPQIGKTYTALYLLYEYYLQGYFPIWESVRQIEQMQDPMFQRLGRSRFDLEGYVRKRLDQKNIIYIEDPWGKISLDFPEEFTATLTTLIQQTAASPARLIISSRSTIFQRVLDIVGTDYAVTLRAEMIYGGIKAAYDEEAKKQLIKKYRENYQAKSPFPTEIQDRIVSTLYSPNSIREFCYQTRNLNTFDQLNKVAYDTEELDRQFAIEILRDIAPFPVGRPNRVVFALLIYLIEHSKNFLRASEFYASNRSMESLFNNAIVGYQNLPFNPFEDAVLSLGERLVCRKYPKKIGSPESEVNWQFVHPVYLEGVRRAMNDIRVRNIMREIVLGFGIEGTCNCGYNGPLVHSYPYICNMDFPSGPVCPKCHKWGKLVIRLAGISFASSLEPLYRELDIITTLNIKILDQLIKINILSDHFKTMMSVDFKKLLCSTIKKICGQHVHPIEFDLICEKNYIKDDTILNEIKEKKFSIRMKPKSSLSTKNLAKIIHDMTADIDW